MKPGSSGIIPSAFSRAAHPMFHRQEIQAFCSSHLDRFSTLCSTLNRREIPYDVLPIGKARHIVLRPLPPSRMDAEYYRVTLVAHYDRVEGTPGANDNAAAVFQLISHWEDIQRLGWMHRTQILFTDKEEITGNMKATDQGSWHLARHLKRLGAKNILFFVLDMCGIGDTPVWGRSIRKAGLLPSKNGGSRAYEVMEGFLKGFTRGEDFGVNPMFSDDLGLLLGGYPAIQLSLLPRNEAEEFVRRFKAKPLDTEAPALARDSMRNSLPPSWQNNHGPGDKVETLEDGSFLLMTRLLRALARYRFPLT